MKICPKCGEKNLDKYKFCIICGSKLEGEARVPKGSAAGVGRKPKIPKKAELGRTTEVSETEVSAKEIRREAKRTTRIPRAIRSPFDEFVIGGVALMAGLLMSWVFAIFTMAVPSVLQTVPPEIQLFLPQFIMFLVGAIIGLYMAKWGVEEMGRPKPAAGVLKYSGILMLVVAAVALAMRWGSGFQVTDSTFWFRMAYVFGIIGMGVYSMLSERRY